MTLIRKYVSVMTAVLILAGALAGCSGVSDTLNVNININSENGNETKDKKTEGYDEAVSAIIDNFMSLTKIPRPSHHEEKIGDFFMEWAEHEEFEPVRDEVGNVIFDVPASEGCEDYPLTCLQVHMDMVCTADEGVDYDPLTDSVKVIRDDEAGTLTADGTSLGADDGIGDAIVMTVAQGYIKHGPLRVIITVNEEDGMDGTFGLDAKWLEDVKYLINLDNESADEVLVSTAAGQLITAYGPAEEKEPEGDLTVSLSLKGLLGGHSGVDIDKGRLNGTIAMAGLLSELKVSGITYELASFSGGTANNAIPAVAQADIVINKADMNALEAACDEFEEKLKDEYAGIEDGIILEIEESDMADLVVRDEDLRNMLDYVSGIIDGIYTMSEDMEGLVESSANLGVTALDPKEGFRAVSYVRSSDADMLEKIIGYDMELAEKCGYEIDNDKSADPWKYDPDSRLLAITKRLYEEQNGEKIKVQAVHAGLECGTFAIMNPSLDMISLGPDVKDVHSTRETLYLNSLPKLWRLLEGILGPDGIGAE